MRKDELNAASELINSLQRAVDAGRLEDRDIIDAVRLARFDAVHRMGAKSHDITQGAVVDEAAVADIRTLVSRIVAFFMKFEPVIDCGITFGGG